MRSASSTLALALLLVACDGDAPTDAGVDAGPPADAGPGDAGAPDAGPGDAGPGDAGPPTMVALAETVGTDLNTLETEAGLVPIEMRVDGAFADLDVAASGIDALIGEEGIVSLSLSDATVRAFADLRQANILLEILDRVIESLNGRSEAAAVRAAAMDLRASLATYRDSLSALFRARLDAGITGTPVVEEMLYINLETTVTGAPARLPAVIEGATSGMETAHVSALCFGTEAIDITNLEVIDEETGTSLGSTSGSDSASLDVTVPFDEATAVAIVFEATPLSPPDYEACGISVLTRRRLRAAAVGVELTNEAYFVARSDYLIAIEAVLAELSALSGSLNVDATTVAAARAHLALIDDLAAPLMPSELLPIPVETYERIERQAVYVRIMIDAALASAPLAHADAAALRTALSTTLDAAEAMITAVALP